MTPVLMVILFCSLVAGAEMWRRPQPRRIETRRVEIHSSIRTMTPAVFVGRRVGVILGRPHDRDADRQLGRSILVAAALGVVHIQLAVIVFLGLRSRVVLTRRRLEQQRTERISAGLADVIDLLAVALLSGNTITTAVRHVVDWADVEYSEAFAWCQDQVAEGHTLSDALEQLPVRLGPQVQPMVSALVATDRYGAPIVPNLIQLATDSRADRRRRAEATARRLPVTMLFPLVVCVLPAFLLLTVVPVLAEALGSFDFTASP